MTTNTHDPREHIRGIHQILISDKKRIGFLLGAGSSFATGLSHVSVPAVVQMTKTIIDEVHAHSPAFALAVQDIQAEIESSETPFNIESLLSTIEAKRAVIGSGALNGLDSSAFSELADRVKARVVRLVSVHEKLETKDRASLAHANLSNWIAKGKRRFPAELFTTNYDYLVEIALEGSGIPYFDGFAGSFEPFFCLEAVEDVDAYSNLVKLWKMHGSLGWTYRDYDKAVIRDRTAKAESILIYPSHLTRHWPISPARLSETYGLPERLVIIGWADQHALTDMKHNPTHIGQVESVSGSTVTIRMASSYPSNMPVIDGTVYRIGQIGSFLKIPLGYANLYGLVTQAGVLAMPESLLIAYQEDPAVADGHHWLRMILIGEQVGSFFERGVLQSPTSGDQVHLVTNEDLRIVYRGYNDRSSIVIGNQCASDGLAAQLDMD